MGGRIGEWVLRGLILVLALWVAFRLLGLESGYPLVAIVAFTPYVAAISVLVLGAALYLRRWPEALAATAAVVLLALVVLPRAIPGQPTGPIQDGVRLDVMTINVHVGEADAADVADAVREGGVDLLSVQELTDGAATQLRREGVDELLPERFLRPETEGSGGAGLYSRYPLRPHPDVPGGISRMLRAEVAVPGAGGVEVVAVHPYPPTERNASNWKRGLEALPRADGGSIRILAGDFNATFDQELFRDLVGSGYVDAADAVGAGLSATWPMDRTWVPRVTIDHVLVEEAAHVAGAEILDISGTDHRGVLATLALPPADRG